MESQPSVWSPLIKNEPNFGSGEITSPGQMEHMTESYADTYGDSRFILADLESALVAAGEFGVQFSDSSYQLTQKVVLGTLTRPDWKRLLVGGRVEVWTTTVGAMLTGLRESEDERHACGQLIGELPDSALPETKETLTELRDYYRSLENPSIRRPTPPPRAHIKVWVLSVVSGGEKEEYVSEPVEEMLQRLREEWRKATLFISSVTKMINHPACQKVIAMGKPVVPVLIQELRKAEEGSYFIMLALHEITQHNPVPLEDAGNIAKMRDAWLRWAEQAASDGNDG